MNRRLSGFCRMLVVGLGFLPWTTTRGEEKSDPQIAVLAGQWKITYSQDAVRVYAIERDGKVSFPGEKRKGQIKRKDGLLLLTFKGDHKLERLTLGTDGRLFVEHYDPGVGFPEKKATHLGIGVREK